jgi:hypothetical protein
MYGNADVVKSAGESPTFTETFTKVFEKVETIERLTRALMSMMAGKMDEDDRQESGGPGMLVALGSLHIRLSRIENGLDFLVRML